MMRRSVLLLLVIVPPSAAQEVGIAKGLAVHHVRYVGGQVSPGREIRFRP